MLALLYLIGYFYIRVTHSELTESQLLFEFWWYWLFGLFLGLNYLKENDND